SGARRFRQAPCTQVSGISTLTSTPGIYRFPDFSWRRQSWVQWLFLPSRPVVEKACRGIRLLSDYRWVVANESTHRHSSRSNQKSVPDSTAVERSNRLFHQRVLEARVCRFVWYFSISGRSWFLGGL